MTATIDPNWAHAVLNFWFAELEPRQWFAKSEVLDKEIAERFGSLHAQQSQKSEDEFLNSPMEALSAIILFDQLSRNLFRGHSQSFATDALALSIANAMVARGWDSKVPQDQRVFVYLPFEHSEEMANQDRSVELIEALGDDDLTRYAHAHRDVIARFGRFPHRNKMLGRASTPAENAYLSEPGSGF